jgi:branched-chain amino acid transport system ATP-binding protein
LHQDCAWTYQGGRTVITVCALETCCGKGSAVGRLNFKEGVSFLLAEQNTNMALKYASYGYILENGRVVMDGEARALAANEDVKEFYLGVAGEKRKSFRYVKHYKRRKRWLI